MSKSSKTALLPPPVEEEFLPELRAEENIRTANRIATDLIELQEYYHRKRLERYATTATPTTSATTSTTIQRQQIIPSAPQDDFRKTHREIINKLNQISLNQERHTKANNSAAPSPVTLTSLQNLLQQSTLHSPAYTPNRSRRVSSAKSAVASVKPTAVRVSDRKTGVLSEIEAAILRSSDPIEIGETEEITVHGQRGIWANKAEIVNWRGVIPITEYLINEDTNPEIITKRSQQQLEYVQELAIRYLRPPTPPAPGEIIITQEANTLTPPAPPLVIRQQPPRPDTPEPLVVREAPPQPPAQVGRKVITISGKRLPPPPRKVVIERLAPLPSKPQSVIIERWLPYSEVKRRVIFNKPTEADPVVVKPRNIIVQWEAPAVQIKKEYKYLGVIRANPVEYVQRYGSALKVAADLPQYVLDFKTPEGLVLAADYKRRELHELEGDVEALKLVDLDKEGLGAYRELLASCDISVGDRARKSSAQLAATATEVLIATATTLPASSRTFAEVNLSAAASGPAQFTPQLHFSLTGTATAQLPVNSITSSASFSSPHIVKNNYQVAASAQLEAASSYSLTSEYRFDNQIDFDSLVRLFSYINAKGDGHISFEELKHVLLVLNQRYQRNYDDANGQLFMAFCDQNRDGSIDLAEFTDSIYKIAAP